MAEVSGEFEHPTSTVADFVASRLAAAGITYVFELVGGMVAPLLDAVHRNTCIEVVSVHHEQAAGFMAEGFARITGNPAVAMATSGPGATNLLTAIGSCYFDSVPAVFITGQVNTHELRVKEVRQSGFQEMDIISMARPVTKFARLVRSADEVPQQLERALQLASTGRPGPVLIDIPLDVQTTRFKNFAINNPEPDRQRKKTDSLRNAFLERMVSALSESNRPLIIAGGGIRTSGGVDRFRHVIEKWKIPVVSSLLGRDAVPGESPFSFGMIGSYGNRWANWAVAESDLLIVLGSRLDIRQTGSDRQGFKGQRQIFHVDVDPAELNHHVTGCDVLESDISEFLELAWSGKLQSRPNWKQWRELIAAKRSLWPDVSENVPGKGINPNIAVRAIRNTWSDIAAFVTDVGQHQMWAAQSLELGPDQRFLTSGGMGAMGFGLPAAMGAAFALPDSHVCLIAGDGGFQCNLQEMQTLVRNQLNVRLVVFDNGCHGMVRQFQQSYMSGRYFSSKWGYSAPEFCEVAGSYGVPSYHIADHEDLNVALGATLGLSGPMLFHVIIDADLNAYPKMAFGHSFGSMEPAAPSREMEGT